MESRESQACVIRINNSFSPFLTPFHSNNPSHTIEIHSKSLQGRSNWTGIFFSFPSTSFCTSQESHQLNAEESILLGVIVFDWQVSAAHFPVLLLFFWLG